MKHRGSHRGCAVETHNGRLRLRFRWKGRRYARQTDLADTAENRREVERLATLIAATSDAGKDPRQLFKKEEDLGPPPMTVAAYYDMWIQTRTPPLVRKAQERDYRKHIGKYVVPALGPIPVKSLRARDILGLMAQLLKRGLSVKYVRNILAASFKAMLRDAREIDELLSHDPFVGVRWPKVTVPGPEPFAAEERTKILRWFETKTFGVRSPGGSFGRTQRRLHPPYHAYVHTLFWTGMRPSEASGLRWSDIDLGAGILRVVRSRHLWEDSAPKTGPAARTVELMPETIRLLRQIQPLHITPEMSVFTNVDGGPIEPNSLLRHWYPCLRALGIRVRGVYATKDTYISTALTAGVNATWLEAQTGVRYETMRRHYGKWVRSEGADQLAKLSQAARSTELSLIVTAKSC